MFTNTLIGQETFRKGYIIKNNGDTLSGMILYELKQSAPRKIVFKRFEIAQPITYKPSDIKAFGYRNANHFESRLVKNKQVFLECFIKGKLSLWGNGNKMFAEKADQIVELKDKEVLYNDKIYSKAYELLRILTNETNELNIPTYISISPMRLTPIVQKYNELLKSEYIVYYLPEKAKENSVELITKEKKHSFGIMSAYNINPTTIGVSGTNYISTPINSYVVNNFSFALFYNYKFNTIFHDISIQVELHFKEFDGAYYIETERKPLAKKYYIDMKSSSNDLRVPISLQYTKPLNSFSVFANIGIINNFRLDENSSGILNVESDGEVLSYNTLNPNKYKEYKHDRSYFLSLGLKKNINSRITLIAESRAEMLFCNLEKDIDFKANNTQIFEFTYPSPLITLVKKSPVISFMVGLSF